MPLRGRHAHRHKSSCDDWPAHKPRDDQSHGRELQRSAISADHRGAVRMDWNRRDDLPWRYDRSPCRSRGGLSRHARRRATCARIRKSSATVTFVYAPSGSPSRSIDVTPVLSVVSSTTYAFASGALRARDRDRIVAELIRPRRGRVGLRERVPIIGTTLRGFSYRKQCILRVPHRAPQALCAACLH